MARTTFSGPVASDNGFIAPVVLTAALPPANSVPAGTVYVISDNGVGNNEYCIVVSNGSAWKTATGGALT
jgi:hypothetical protein